MFGVPIKVNEDVAAFHKEALVVDLHNDLLTKVSHAGFDISRRHRSAWFWNPARLDLDLPKIHEGGINALGSLMFAGFRFDPARRFWRQLDTAQELADRHSEVLCLARSVAEIRAARAAGKTALFLGVEGAYVVEKDIGTHLPRLARAGVRFLGPMWDRDNAVGTACRSGDDRGLTTLGATLIAACNHHGIAVDVSHSSRKTFWDIANISQRPLFSSHSGAAGVYAHPRNLDDDQIREIARQGGVVGVIFVASFLGGAFCSLPRIAAHIEHVANIGGEDCVALGSDFDGFMPLPRGMRDAADLPSLTQVLWNRGYRGDRLRKLLGENALRYFGDVWRDPVPGPTPV